MDVLIQWVQALINWVKCIPTAIYCAFTAFANFMIDLLKYFALKMYSLFAEALAAFLAVIPVPEFLAQLQGHLDSASQSIGYIFGLTQLDYGLKIVISASVLKFLIRRIPGIG